MVRCSARSVQLLMLILSRCIALNAASLACGFAGNIFLLFNFTRRIRYIVALPMTIILWYFATGIVSCPCLISYSED